MKWLLAPLAILLIGCTSATQPVYLVNADGATVQCGPYDNHAMKSAASALRESQCINDYREQGYHRR